MLLHSTKFPIVRTSPLPGVPQNRNIGNVREQLMTSRPYQFNKRARVGSDVGPDTREAAPKAESQ